MYESRFWTALLLTICLEAPVLWALTRLAWFHGGKRPGPARVLAAAVLASGATLPYVWFVSPPWFQSRTAALAASEGLAVLAEALIYRLTLALPWPGAFLASLSANLVSWALGAMIF